MQEEFNRLIKSLAKSRAGSVEMGDVQGLVLRGYNFPNIRYAILSIKDTAGARKFCADLALRDNPNGLQVTDGSPWKNRKKPDYCLNIGFTYEGMKLLISETNCTAIEKRSSMEVFGAFKKGSVADAEYLGDTGESDPKNWWKYGTWKSKDYLPGKNDGNLHIQITLFALNEKDRVDYYDKLLKMIPQTADGPSVVPVFYQDSDPLIVDGDPEYVHFGYRDSLSQPRIEGLIWDDPTVKRLMGDRTVDDRPMVPADRFVIAQPADDYNAHPLLINGTFAAFRLLYQDEAKFNAFLKSDKNVAPELMAAKICGRWRDGTPLVVSPDKEDKDLGKPDTRNFNFTNFDYITPSDNQQGKDPKSDEDGSRCPYGSHIRRANPRDDNNVNDNDDMAVTHRILRRASPYGRAYDPTEEDGVQRGLVGLFIGSTLDFQFRFVTKFWFNQVGFRNNDESPNQSGIDPIIGPQAGMNDTFAYNDKGKYREIPGLSRFVRTDGSLYLFLPGIKGLEYLSQGKIPSN